MMNCELHRSTARWCLHAQWVMYYKILQQKKNLSSTKKNDECTSNKLIHNFLCSFPCSPIQLTSSYPGVTTYTSLPCQGYLEPPLVHRDVLHKLVLKSEPHVEMTCMSMFNSGASQLINTINITHISYTLKIWWEWRKCTKQPISPKFPILSHFLWDKKYSAMSSSSICQDLNIICTCTAIRSYEDVHSEV